MSATQSRPDSQQTAWRRVDAALRTRVLDLLRGRVEPYVPTPPVRAADVIAQANLPEELADMVWQVVRRTRLWPGEQVGVARELAAHFQDGLAAGVTAEELRATFGDIGPIAALIRRAKRRKRPLWWRVPKAGFQAIGAVVLLALAIYTVQAVRIYGGTVRITRDYVAEWNAPALAIPEAERAWPLYREAALALGPERMRRNYDDARPGTEDWPLVVLHVEENQAAAAKFRAAAARPQLGTIIFGDDRTELGLCSDGTFTNIPSQPYIESWNPDIAVSLTPFAVLRAGIRLLTLDSFAAAEKTDAERAVADLLAVAAIVGHSFEPPLLIADVVGVEVTHRALRTVGTLLAQYPALFDDAHLQQLAHRVSAIGGPGGLHVRFEHERAMLADSFQRHFTDDGNGNGLPRPELLTHMDFLGDRRSNLSRSGARWLAPALSVVMADRRETAALVDGLFAHFDKLTRTPLWQRRDRGLDAEFERFVKNEFSRLRYLPMTAYLPGLEITAALPEYAQQARDATVTALALELFRRRHGEYPKQLEQLTPDLLPVVPSDRYDGGPIKYCLVDGRPLLYSVGVDQDDDGGRLPQPARLPSGPDRRSANRRARDYISPSVVAQLEQEGMPPSHALADGDWILWPPVD
jgi:hypothetical protein